jgi:hypothetical protein
MSGLFSKADWEPYVGPQGGKGWRNVETDEVVYDDQPPGGVSLPDEFPGELDPDFNLDTLDPDDQVLAITSDGEPVVVDADNPYISQDDVFGVIEEEAEVDSIEEEWDERDPSELSNIPVGTEVRLETMTESVTGEFEGEVGGEYIEEWSIDGNPFSVGELTEPDTELYVNEESIPENDIPGDGGDSSADDVNVDVDELLSQDPTLENEEPNPTTEGEQLVEDLVEKHDMPEEDWDFDPDEVGISEIQPDILALCPGVLVDDFAEYKWDTLGDFLRDHPDPVMAGDLYDVMEVADDYTGGQEDFQVGDSFSFSNADGLNEGQFVSVSLNSGKEIAGEVVKMATDSDYMKVVDSNGDTDIVRFNEVMSGDVVDGDDLSMGVEELPEDPTVDDITSKIRGNGIDPSSATGSDKRETAEILIGAKEEKGASNDTIASVIANVDGSRNRQRIANYMLDSVTQYSEKLDMDVPMTRDNNVESELKKITKTFQEEHPEYAERLDDLFNQFSEWTGGTVREDTSAMWAVAIENGEDNVPEQMADWVDELEQEDPELIDAMQEYSDMTTEVLRDMFGDSVMLYRGIDGDYGKRKKDEVINEGEATLDHRGIASWTLNPDVTSSFTHSRGVMTAQEIDVEDILVGFPSSTGFDYELELVASGGVEEYSEAQSPDEVGSGSIVPDNTLLNKDKLKLFMEQYDEISAT